MKILMVGNSQDYARMTMKLETVFKTWVHIKKNLEAIQNCILWELLLLVVLGLVIYQEWFNFYTHLIFAMGVQIFAQIIQLIQTAIK